MTEDQENREQVKAETSGLKSKVTDAKDRVLAAFRRSREKKNERTDQPRKEAPDKNLRALVEYASKERYGTQELGMHEATEVPTTQGKVTFFKESYGYQTDRDADDYTMALFSAEYTESEKVPGQPTVAVPRTEEVEAIAGGEKHFFEDGDTFVDLGSGEAVALIQTYLRYRSKNPNAKFIGVDHGYQDAPPLDINEPGVQLVQDDWGKLDQFPPNSVDRFLSVQGAFIWGRKSDDSELRPEAHSTKTDIVKAITRVAKTGAILRFDCDEAKREGNEAIAELEKHGWKVNFEPNTAVAVKES
ncbi:MAG TPA: hypothetical protein VLF93_00245 [Candidatus Saccharimonadales bacterium]|nr:hypothetical protein [Candidatus Saccharimonadales bacterium]